MTATKTLLDRNHQFARSFASAEMPPLPKLRTVLLTCGDARVDPAHIFGLELGDAVVIRNNGGRVTGAVVHELATLAFMVAAMDGDSPKAFEVVIVQHTQCGAERLADPTMQAALRNVGVDVSESAIEDHDACLLRDIQRLRDEAALPPYIVVSGLLYDVSSGTVREVVAPSRLRPDEA